MITIISNLKDLSIKDYFILKKSNFRRLFILKNSNFRWLSYIKLKKLKSYKLITCYNNIIIFILDCKFY